MKRRCDERASLSRLFWEPEGRISRRTYALGVAALIGLVLTFGWIPILGPFVVLGCTLSLIVITTKRLHDFGRSGWLQLAPIALQAAMLMGGVSMMLCQGFPFCTASAQQGLGLLLLLGSSLPSLAFVAWAALTPGDPGHNHFGDCADCS